MRRPVFVAVILPPPEALQDRHANELAALVEGNDVIDRVRGLSAVVDAAPPAIARKGWSRSHFHRAER
jgi:hypothetical protein